MKLKGEHQQKQQQQAAKYDLNDCLLESENITISKSDNNKYLLLPMKKQQQQQEKFVLKECGKHDFSKTKTKKNTFFIMYTYHHPKNIINTIHHLFHLSLIFYFV